MNSSENQIENTEMNETTDQTNDQTIEMTPGAEDQSGAAGGEEGAGGDVLVVASKLKNYIRAKSGMNTSSAVMGVVSDRVRQLCDQAMETAKRDGRKTVMDRDFQ